MRRFTASIALVLCSYALVGTTAFSIQSTARSRTNPISFTPDRLLYTSPPPLASRPLRSPLFSASVSQQQKLGQSSPSLLQRLLRRPSSLKEHNKRQRNGSRWLSKFQRSFAILWTVSLLWFGAARFSTHAAHASTTSRTTQEPRIERVLSATSPSLDTIVNRYVKNHMFDDDQYDPVESVYREAFDDALTGKYPQALREVASGALGSGGKMSVNDRDTSAGAGIASLLTTAIGALQKKGLSQQAAILVLASIFVVAGPSTFLVVGMVIGGISKRNMNKVMKQRYGDTYTVDATTKPEEDVDAPDDDDDDEGDDDDDDDDDDDEDGDDD